MNITLSPARNGSTHEQDGVDAVAVPKSKQNPSATRAFPINILPEAQDFIAANKALDQREDGYVSGSFLQHYIALIASCVQRGHQSVADIVAQVAPLVGARNAAHVPWLIETLAGPACDVHLWDYEPPEDGRYFYGPTIELKPELESLASAHA